VLHSRPVCAWAFAMEPATNRKATAARAPATRSAATNGTRQFAIGGDGRTPWARRHRDIASLHIEDLGSGGNATEAQLSLCERAATIECELERLEGRLSAGDETVDLDCYGRMTGQLRRILETLGIHRPAKTLAPDLKSCIEGSPVDESPRSPRRSQFIRRACS
jgi:hypothetical protein